MLVIYDIEQALTLSLIEKLFKYLFRLLGFLQSISKENDAVHLRAAFCDVGCNRVVRRRGCMRPLHAAFQPREKGAATYTRYNATQFSSAPFSKSAANASLAMACVGLLARLPVRHALKPCDVLRLASGRTCRRLFIHHSIHSSIITTTIFFYERLFVKDS